MALIVTDDYTLADPRTPTVFNFMTTRPLDVATPGCVRFGAFPGQPASRSAVLNYDASAFTAAVDTVELTDTWLKSNWGEQVFRLRLTERAVTPQACREFRLTAAG